MTCSVCGDSLNGTYFTFLNKLICERDYNVSLSELANIDARYLLQGGRFVMILGSPLKIRLKLHYLVRKRLFSDQNGGRK